MHTPKERVGLSPAAAAVRCSLLAATTTHAHALVCVCVVVVVVAVAAAVAVGQAPLGRSAVGIVCLWVRVGGWCAVGILLVVVYPPQHTPHTNEQTDDPPVDISIERDSVGACVCVSILYR